jgi:hypothetical protein
MYSERNNFQNEKCNVKISNLSIDDSLNRVIIRLLVRLLLQQLYNKTFVLKEES